jgi:hypothetical protein
MMKDPKNLTSEEKERLVELQAHISQLLQFSSSSIIQSLAYLEQETGEKLNYCLFLFSSSDDSNHRCIVTDTDEAKLRDVFKEQVDRLQENESLIRDLKRITHEGSLAIN